MKMDCKGLKMFTHVYFHSQVEQGNVRESFCESV